MVFYLFFIEMLYLVMFTGPQCELVQTYRDILHKYQYD